jgi:hypothetical protein
MNDIELNRVVETLVNTIDRKLVLDILIAIERRPQEFAAKIRYEVDW